MCIILTCKPNTRPSSDLVANCFYNNPDGAGIMWVENGRVQTSKGYMSEDALEKAIASVPKESPLVIHMRIATSGGVSAGTCHPFPVSKSLTVLHAENTECDAAVAHNGVIKGMHTNAKLGVSDTVTFVSDVIARMWRRDNKVTRKMKRRISAAAPNNRFAILTKSGNVYRIGDGWESVSPGIEASNSSWRYSRLSYVDDLDWADVKYDYYRDSGYSASYRDVFDFWCKDCPNCATCLAYGACCDDIADYIDELDRDDKAHSYSEDDDDWYGYLYDGVGYNLASQDIPF
ncbi:MAG: hypothetical protein IJG82_09535 [Atopobiaceae bacterium]|nr:hypothetical protein [Atopobiaceae bacterium]